MTHIAQTDKNKLSYDCCGLYASYIPKSAKTYSTKDISVHFK